MFSVLLYGADAWTLTNNIIKKLDLFQDVGISENTMDPSMDSTCIKWRSAQKDRKIQGDNKYCQGMKT